MMAIPRAAVGAVRLDAQKELGDEAVEDRSAHSPIDAAESLDLVERQLQARHLEVFGANTFTNFIGRSHDYIVEGARRETNRHFCTRAHSSDQCECAERRTTPLRARRRTAMAQVASIIAPIASFTVCAAARASHA